MSMQADSATANWCGGVLLMIGLTGCGGYETAYERAVYDAEPVYCYRTVADPDCYRAADPASNRRLVNYYGPSPRRAKAPRPAEIRLEPPPAADAATAVPGRPRPKPRPWERGRNRRCRFLWRHRPTPRVWEGRVPGRGADRPPTTRPTTRARRKAAPAGGSPGPTSPAGGAPLGGRAADAELSRLAF